MLAQQAEANAMEFRLLSWQLSVEWNHRAEWHRRQAWVMHSAKLDRISPSPCQLYKDQGMAKKLSGCSTFFPSGNARGCAPILPDGQLPNMVTPLLKELKSVLHPNTLLLTNLISLGLVLCEYFSRLPRNQYSLVASYRQSHMTGTNGTAPLS